MIPLKDKLDRLIRNNIQRIAKDAGISGTITKQEHRGTDTSTPVHKDEKMVNYYCKLTSKDYKAFEHLKRNNPDKVLRFVEDYANDAATLQTATAAVPPNLGEEICVGSSIYVWTHKNERLKKMADMEERLYILEQIDEQEGDYRLLKFIPDNCC